MTMKPRHYILCAIVILVGLPVLALGLLRAVDAHRAAQWTANYDRCDAVMVAHGFVPFSMEQYANETYRDNWLVLCKPFHRSDNPWPMDMDCEQVAYVVSRCESPTRSGDIATCNQRIWSTCAALFPSDHWYGR